MRLRAAGLLAVLAAGCGTSDADRVRAKLADLGDADARTLCRDVLSADLIAAQERITGRPCAATARSLVGRPGRRVREIRVDGDLATARLGAETVTLVRTRAGWRLASLGNDGGGSPSRP